MPTWGYGLVAVLALALATYALWPDGKAAGVAPFPDPIAAEFTVTGAFGEQAVVKDRIKVAGMDRPADAMAVDSFRKAAPTLRAEASRVVEGVDAKAARAWGIDGTRRLVSGTEERAWGEADNVAAVWDPARRRAYLLNPTELRRIVLAAARLDAKTLVDLGKEPAWISVDGVRLESKDGHWTYAGDRRPPADGRMLELFGLLRSATLDGPGSAPAEATAEHELRWPDASGGEARLRILAAGERSWLALDGAPPQPQPANLAARWREAIAALASDRPCDPVPSGEVKTVRVLRAGAEVLRLEHRGPVGPEGQPWAVVWPGGAEPADAGAGERMAEVVRKLSVLNPTRGEELSGPGTTAIEIAAEHGTPWTVVLGGGRVWSGGWYGDCARLPPPLDDLRPDAFLDLRPCPLDPARSVKLQRRWGGDASRDETASRPPGGTWRRTWPATAGTIPVDDNAVQRVARALCRLRANHVRLTGPAERSLPMDAEIALRFAPKESQHTGAEDEIELEDTMPQERGWRLSRLGAGWIMVEIDGSLTFDIDSASAEELLADISSDRLFPVAPALVNAIEVGGPEPFRLENRGDGWSLRIKDQESPAEGLAVRRLLRALTALSARKPATAAAENAVPVAIDTSEGERITIAFGQPTADGIPAVTPHGGLLVEDRAAWSQVDLHPATYRKP